MLSSFHNNVGRRLDRKITETSPEPVHATVSTKGGETERRVKQAQCTLMAAHLDSTLSEHWSHMLRGQKY